MPSQPSGPVSRYRVRRLSEVDSTNAEAIRLAAAGETGPLWLQSEVQTQGRGRAGRSWVSPRGNLFASLLLRLNCPAGVVHQLSLLAGVAVIDAVVSAAKARHLTLHGLRLKWPNDALIGTAKFAGVLPESFASIDGLQRIVVIGVGINLASHPPDLDRDVTDLAEQGLRLSPDDMLSELAKATEEWLSRWNNGQAFTTVRSAWLDRAGPIGEWMSIRAGNARIEGAFAGLDNDGALLVCESGGMERRFSYGDVSLQPAPPVEGGQI